MSHKVSLHIYSTRKRSEQRSRDDAALCTHALEQLRLLAMTRLILLLYLLGKDDVALLPLVIDREIMCA